MSGDRAKRRLKRMLGGAALAAIGLASVGVLGVAGDAIGALQTVRGLDPANPVDDAAASPPWADAPDATVLWPIDAAVRAEVGRAYVRAWTRIERSLDACRDDALDTAFAGAALEQARSEVVATRESGCQTGRSASGHQLRLRFVSADGTLVVAADEGVTLTDRWTVPGPGAATLDSRASFLVTLVLDDGDWRVHDLVATALEPAPAP